MAFTGAIPVPSQLLLPPLQLTGLLLLHACLHATRVVMTLIATMCFFCMLTRYQGIDEFVSKCAKMCTIQVQTDNCEL